MMELYEFFERLYCTKVLLLLSATQESIELTYFRKLLKYNLSAGHNVILF